MNETLQIHNVPEELYTSIVEHAHAQGITISQYLLRRIAQIEGKPEIGEILDTHWQRTNDRMRARAGAATELLAEDRKR